MQSESILSSENLAVEYMMHLMAPAKREEPIAGARVVRSGKTLKVCSAEVYVRGGSEQKHSASMLAAIMCLAGKSDGAERK